ncbi:hypothetical protein LCGC14_0910860 [marine sediment metagenome]|uniref:Uncharacterized protein n=1 Tax=marine sediment metagenome TaxID=412755 RepID=A0A0F9RCM1_9ZZZZ
MWKISQETFEILKDGPWFDEYDYFLESAKKMVIDANKCGLTPKNMGVKNFQDAHDLNLIVWVDQ